MPNIRQRWRGRWVTQSVYDKRMKQTEAGKNIKKLFDDGGENITSHEEEKHEETFACYRLIDYELWTWNLRCKFCNSILDPEKTEKEIRQGLFSVLKIRCPECLYLHSVPTSSSHVNAQGTANIPDVNSRMTLGALRTGLGHTQAEKMFEICGLHAPTSKTFKRRRREVGSVVEKMAKDSYMKAAALKRELSIKNFETLSELL